MGKATRRKRHIPRYDPKAANGSAADSAEDAHRGVHKARQQSANGQVKPWLQKLAAPADSDRLEACKSLAALLLADPANRKALLKAGGVKLLLDRLTDGVEDVRLAAASALRCAIEDEDCMEETCRTLYAANILAILQSQFANMLSVASDRARLESQLGLADDLLAILLTMIEVSDSTLRAVNKQVPSLLDLSVAVIRLGSQGTPPPAALTAAYCLLTYIEGNDVALAAINGNAAMATAINTIEAQDKHLSAVLAALTATLLLAQAESPPDGSTSMNRVLQTLSGVLATTDLVAIAGDTAGTSDHKLFAAETALEVLAKSVCVEEQNSDDMAIDTTASETVRQYISKKVGTDMLDEVTRLATPIASAAAPIVRLPQNTEAMDEDDSAEVVYPSKLLKVHLYALDALHNLAWSTISDTDLAQATDWSAKSLSLWQWGLQTLPAILTTDEEVADSAISLLYAVAKFRNGDLPCTAAEVNDFIKLYNSSLNAELQSKIVGLLGALALTGARDPSRGVDVNRAAGTFLITAIASLPRTDRECALEALDAVFDVYADKEYAYDEAVFHKLGFLDHLRKSVPKVRQLKNTTDRRRDPAGWARCNDALQNLEAFVAYKAGERR